MLQLIRAAILAIRWQFAVAFSVIVLPWPALAVDLDGTVWESAARTEGNLDPLLLYAIALTESGRADGEGKIKPWPWALNVEGKAFFAGTREEAAELLETYRGRSVDVGLLQVNTRWHGHRVQDLVHLLDPETNLTVGARILKEALDASPGDLTAGIGRYHSGRQDRARRYARIVVRIYQFLLHNQEKGA